MNDTDIADKHKDIGKNVAMYRKEKGLSQLDLSLQLGHKSVSIVASAELKISEIFDITITSFFEPYIEPYCITPRER